MKAYDLYLWEPVLSPHKIGLCKALLGSGRVRQLYYISQKDFLPDRRDMGWSTPELGDIKYIGGPTEQECAEIVDKSPEDSIHLFSGIHWVPAIVSGLKFAMRANRRFGLMCEPRDIDGFKGKLRLLHSWVTEGRVRARAGFILAIGRHGPPWFRWAGYPPAKIFPFAYFLDDYAVVERGQDNDARFRVGFVGRMNRKKGFPIFLEAARELSRNVLFEAYGIPDKPRADLDSDMTENFSYRGVVSMDEIARVMAYLDLLVVPSTTKDDGWAMVVSEALAQGTPVLASRHVGGSICLEVAENGRIIDSPTPARLAKAITQFFADRAAWDGTRQDRRQWASDRLSGAAGAAYLLSILDHIYGGLTRPKPFYE